MARERFTVEAREWGCHPETCNHVSHPPYWIWDEKDRKYVEGFSSRTGAESEADEYNSVPSSWTRTVREIRAYLEGLKAGILSTRGTEKVVR